MAKNKLLIIVGQSGSGKTQFAKHYSKENQATYLDFDLLFDYQDVNTGFTKLINKLSDLIKNSDSTSFVLDGYILYMPSNGDISFRHAPPTIAYLEDCLDVEIKLCFCFAAPHVLHRRQTERQRLDPLHQQSSAKTKAILKDEAETLFSKVILLDSNPLIVDTTGNAFSIIDCSVFPQRWQELSLLSDLEDMQYDKLYQDIELPSGTRLVGYSESAKTWDRLSSIIEFKDKSVLDIGCFHGFFSFKAEEVGARLIKGMDNDERAWKMAWRIGWLKKSKALFAYGDIDSLTVDQPYDIILVLNMLHYSKNLSQALENIFRSGNLAVFEMPMEQETAVCQYASKNSFQLAAKANSYRLGRGIFVFKNPHSPTHVTNVPKQYEFSWTRYQLHRLIQEGKRLKIARPILYWVRKYRQYRRNKNQIIKQ